MDIEIDMENEEIDVRRIIFEEEIKLILQNYNISNRQF